MSDFNLWYVIGRAVRLAICYAVFASLSVANPTFAAEVSNQAAQQVADSLLAANTSAIAETEVSVDASEPENLPPSSVQAAGEEDDFNSNDIEAAFEGLMLPASNEVFDLILSVQRKARTLSSATIGIQKGFEYYVPMNELAQILKFPSTLDLNNRRISGYFFNEQNAYILDAETLTAQVAGETVKLPANSIVIRDYGQGIGDIYLTPEALNMIWPLRLELDFSQQSILIKTPRKLPFELAEERRLLQQSLGDDEEDFRNLNIDHIPNGYRFLGPQTLSLGSTYRWEEESGEIETSSFINGRGDFLGTNASYTVATSTNDDQGFELDDLRVNFSRRDFGDGSLLPYGLRLVRFGDISSRTAELVERGISGRGVYISTGSDSIRRRSFDRTTIEGVSAPGWEAELYKRNELIDFTDVGSDGIYRFEEVQLEYGNNTFKIILYGPQGQIEERIEEFDISQRLLKPGETNFEASLIQQGQRFIDINDRNTDDVETTKFARVNRGINEFLSGYATFTQTELRGENQEYLSVGANFNALNGAGEIEAYKQLDGGQALGARFATRFAGFRTNLSASVFDNFESRDVGVGDGRKKYEGSINIGRSVPTELGDLNLAFRARHTERVNTSNGQLGFTQSIGIDDVSLSNSITSNIANREHDRTRGQFNLNKPLSDQWGFGTSLFYDVYPDTFIDSVRGRLSYKDQNNFSSTLSVRQGIQDTSQTSANLSSAYDFGTFLGSANVGWDNEDGFDFTLSANTTLSPQGEDNVYEMHSRLKPERTRLSARIYHDANMDGEFNDDDQPIEGGRIVINGRQKSRLSDKDGKIRMTSAGGAGVAIITYDTEGSPDPFLAPLKDSYKTILRPGTEPFINFPLIMTGSIDGVVRFADGRPVPGVIVQLVDAFGQLVTETPTLSDGFYVFEFVKPGRYLVQLSPSHPVFVPTKTVTVASDDLFAYGVDLQILEQATEASVTESAESGRVAHTSYHDAPVAGGTELPVSTLSDRGVQSVIRAVRVGEYPDKVRLVLDLSAPVSYEVYKEKDSERVYIDLPGTLPDIDSSNWKSGKHALFSQIDIQPGKNGTQIHLDPNSSLMVQESALLPATDTLPPRLYIDFTKEN